MTHVIIGSNGQIGSCISQFLSEKGETDVVKVDMGMAFETKPCELMHVCIPYSPQFVFIIKQYQKVFTPKQIIVYSTVLPGTTELIGDDAVHSPIEGRHPDLLSGFKSFTRFVSGKSSEIVGRFFKKMGLAVKTFEDTKITELGKLLSTTRYGVNIVFAKAQSDLCNQLGLDFNDVVLAYQKMYNDGYTELNETRFVQPLLTPPDKIGGHCVVPNAKLLTQISDDKFISSVATFNGAA